MKIWIYKFTVKYVPNLVNKTGISKAIILCVWFVRKEIILLGRLSIIISHMIKVNATKYLAKSLINFFMQLGFRIIFAHITLAWPLQLRFNLHSCIYTCTGILIKIQTVEILNLNIGCKLLLHWTDIFYESLKGTWQDWVIVFQDATLSSIAFYM